MKRICSMALAMVLLVSFTLPVIADETDGTTAGPFGGYDAGNGALSAAWFWIVDALSAWTDSDRATNEKTGVSVDPSGVAVSTPPPRDGDGLNKTGVSIDPSG